MVNPPVILFDGVCNLCNSAVQLVIRNDPAEKFLFAPLQSEVAEELIGDDAKKVDSLVLVKGQQIYHESDAALRIARELRGGWKIFYIFILLPRFIRDGMYRVVARYRYRWFGKKDQCMVPTPDLQSRFLDSSDDLYRFAHQKH